jgi:hypothetical protein
MKRTSKFALLSAAALAAVGTVKAAPGDLLVGVYNPAVANTFVADIGSFSSLYNGETWDLSAGLTSAGFSTGGGGTIGGANFGVVGYNQNGSTLYLTTGSGGHPDLSNSDWGTAAGYVDGMSANLGAQQVLTSGGSSSDWYTQTINQYNQSGNLIGALGGYNVNTTQPGNATLISEDQFTRNPSGSFDYFTLSTSGILTYVPEPSVFSFAGVGFLLLTFRRRFGKQ